MEKQRGPRRATSARAWAVITAVCIILAVGYIACGPRSVSYRLPAGSGKNHILLSTDAEEVILKSGRPEVVRVGVRNWLPLKLVMNVDVYKSDEGSSLDLVDENMTPHSSQMQIELAGQSAWWGEVRFSGKDLIFDTRGLSAREWSLESPSRKLNLHLAPSVSRYDPTFIETILGPNATTTVVADSDTVVFLATGNGIKGRETLPIPKPGTNEILTGTYLGAPVRRSNPDVILYIEKYTKDSDSIRMVRADEIDYVIQP